MRFNLETENLICAFPLLETRTTTINRTRQAREATDENAPRSKKQKLNFSEIKCLWYQVKTFIT